MSRIRIFSALSTFAQEDPAPLEALKASGHEILLNSTGKRLTKSDVIRRCFGFDGIIAGLEPYDREVLEALSGLRCISRCGVGVDNVDLVAAREKNICVFNTPQVVVRPVAELTLAMILDLLRRVTAHTELMRQGRWERLMGRDLAGKTAGIVGLGRIGRKVAQVLKALDVHIIACDVAPDIGWAEGNGLELVSLEELLGRSDIITLHLSGAGTSAILGAAQFAQMKKGAVLINVARGGFVNEAALVQALSDGTLAGAGLDVYGAEPYAGPLAALANVVLTPHVGTLTAESRSAMEMEAVTNLLEFLGTGLPL